MGTWRFSELHRDAKLREPTQEAFFDDSDVLTDVISLVRESVQNSIDARVDPSEPVVQCFTLSEFNPQSPEKQRYFSGLEGHLVAVRGSAIVDQLGLTGRSLIIEDFNTTGLTGYTQNLPPKTHEKENSNFFYFVHAEGSTNKAEGKRGKWGIGKVVFPKVSLIKSFFIFSNRISNNQLSTVALGQAVLKSHSIGDKHFQPDGWFANYSDSTGYVELDEKESKALRDDWNLKRSDETGLSILVPFVNNQISAEALKQSLIEQYFLAIINDDLVCKIEDETGNVTLLDSSTIGDQVQTLRFADQKKQQDFAQLVELAVKAKTGKLKSFKAKSQNFKSDETKNINVDNDLVEITDQFNLGEPLLLEIPLFVPLPGVEKEAEDKFHILLKKNQGNTSQVTYSREGILVPGRRAKYTKNAICLILVEAGPLADLLGLSEGPAHENWAPEAEKFRAAFGSTTKASQVISFVRQQPVDFINSLLASSEVMDSSLLSRFFKLPSESSSGEKVDDPGRLISQDPSVEQVRVSNFNDGFKLVDAGGTLPVKSQVVVTAAYGVAKGNAFAKWSPNDFQLSELARSSKNITLHTISDNVAIFEIDSPEFEISFSGFDILRNIELDIQTLIAGRQAERE